METKEEIFNKTSDNFKKICTTNGIDQEALIDFIINSIKLLPEESKLDFLQSLILEEVLMCTNDIYEALGVLGLAKANFLKIMETEDES